MGPIDGASASQAGCQHFWLIVKCFVFTVKPCSIVAAAENVQSITQKKNDWSNFFPEMFGLGKGADYQRGNVRFSLLLQAGSFGFCAGLIKVSGRRAGKQRAGNYVEQTVRLGVFCPKLEIFVVCGGARHLSNKFSRER